MKVSRPLFAADGEISHAAVSFCSDEVAGIKPTSHALTKRNQQLHITARRGVTLDFVFQMLLPMLHKKPCPKNIEASLFLSAAGKRCRRNRSLTYYAYIP